MGNSEFIIMKDKEFVVLGALCGLRTFFGNIHIDYKKLNKQEIYTIFYQLYKKGFITYEEKGIVLPQEIRSLFEDLKKSEKLMRIININTSENLDFYYLHNQPQCINLQKSWEDRESIKIRRVSKSDIVDLCEQMELFPKQLLDETLIHHIVPCQKEQAVKEYLEVSVYDLASEGKVTDIQIRLEGLNDVMTYSSKEREYKEIYVLEHLKQSIAALLQEK